MNQKSQLAGYPATEPAHFPQAQNKIGENREVNHEDLIRKNEGRIYRFDELPLGAALAVASYMGVDGESWDLTLPKYKMMEGLPKYEANEQRNFTLVNEILQKNLTRAIMDIVQDKAEVEIGFMNVLTEDLIEECVRIQPDMANTLPKFGSKSNDKNPYWSVILSPWRGELLERGWDDFYAYIATGSKYVPVVWFPEGGICKDDN